MDVYVAVRGFEYEGSEPIGAATTLAAAQAICADAVAADEDLVGSTLEWSESTFIAGWSTQTIDYATYFEVRRLALVEQVVSEVAVMGMGQYRHKGSGAVAAMTSRYFDGRRMTVELMYMGQAAPPEDGPFQIRHDRIPVHYDPVLSNNKPPDWVDGPGYTDPIKVTGDELERDWAVA